jgi:DNA polymerase-1
LGLPTRDVRKTPSGGYSTDEEVLAKLAMNHPLPKCLLEYRMLAKLKSTYTDKLPLLVNAHTGRVHTTYGQAIAMTGRLASSDPNLQNIPIRNEEGRAIRQAFIAPPNHVLLSADYSQIELRIMAHFSQDASMIKAFNQSEDIHRSTAAELFGVPPESVTPQQRRYAKSINFGLIYGMSAFGLAAQLEIDRSQAQIFIDRYFEQYPGVKRFMDETRIKVREDAFIETLFGRRLYLPEIHSKTHGGRAGAERAAINAPMQGTAADLIKRAMLIVEDWLIQKKLATRMIMQVHDELVFEVPEYELSQIQEHIPRLMAQADGGQLSVPLLVEVGFGKNWDEAH